MSFISSKVYSPFNDPFSYSDWDPFFDFYQFGGALAHHHHHPHHVVAGHPTAFPLGVTRHARVSSSKIERKETPEAHIVKAEVPGLKREEVKVELEEGGDVLCISGEKKVEKEEKNGNWYRVEHSSGKFVQRVRLPEKAIADKMKAHMENGVITITIPKREINNSSRTLQIF
ncbi:18.1 kDa class I heat shock protein [Ricinus communis]|uniref:Heat-shock protein, putative n=1 Tax=Ricinus communis TaxID=3988 RepID=B9T7G2_RICCO|nr:18.1 kDa class I heat shock protein [Ricinus communis]EEF28205.1 heat-shock protein, putative [Ricinus communis]|eukprot:XP_002534181.1 18.1 kDa class I heat shock protein [Ricinus communis]